MKMKRILAMLLCIILMCNMLPINVSAIGEDEQEEVLSGEIISDVSGTESETEEPDVTPDKIYPSFDQSKTIGDVTITVQAEEGIFPGDAVLFVSTVEAYTESQVDTVISELRGEEVSVAASYTFDIKVIDPVTGEEYQPQDGQTVRVLFTTAEVAKENLTTSVYHIDDEGTVEKLDVSEQNTDTVSVESSGFSIYYVDFTYSPLRCFMHGDTSISLNEILKTLDLSGEVTAVESSDDSCFSASMESGEWIVTAHKSFSSTEWMKVTIDGTVYEIEVKGHDNVIRIVRVDSNCDEVPNKNLVLSHNVETVTFPAMYRPKYALMGYARTKDGPVAFPIEDPVDFHSNNPNIHFPDSMTVYAVWSPVTIDDIEPTWVDSWGEKLNYAGILWDIIGESDDKMLLISHDILGGSMNMSDADAFLFTMFDTFSPLEKSLVLKTTKTDDLEKYRIPNNMVGGYYLASNLDRADLFYLSASEAAAYFTYNFTRQSTGYGTENCWWLRSTYYKVTQQICSAGVVTNEGSFDYMNAEVSDLCGARPAFVLDKSSPNIFFITEYGNKTDPPEKYSSFTTYSCTDGFKAVTLFDSSRNGFTANIEGSDSASVKVGETIEIDYSGAKTGEYEYVSAMLLNSEGTPIGYATTESDSDGADTWSLTLPRRLIEGATYKLKVFSESRSNRRAHYASTPVEITLTVSGVGYSTNQVTVINGTGSGTYDEDNSVTIKADPPEDGKLFKGWTGTEGLVFTHGGASSSTATFLMPDNSVEITATYENMAVTEKNASNTVFEIRNIAEPSGEGQWNYVYYGKYDNTPVKYRVLDKDSRAFNPVSAIPSRRETMLLDCDSILFLSPYDVDTQAEWKKSSLKSGLNGADFYSKPGVFTQAEKDAIALSTKEGRNSAYDGDGFGTFAKLSNEKIFLLDPSEAMSPAYGYANVGTAISSRQKGNWGYPWWLRSSSRPYGASNIYTAYSDGRIYSGHFVRENNVGVSPAFNLETSAIVLSTELASEPGSFKLTLRDENLNIQTNGTITRSKDTITVPTSVTGTYNRVSVMMLNRDWNAYGKTIKYYAKLDSLGRFTLPDDYDKNWKTYIIAEQENYEKETDYISNPMEITIPPRPNSISIATQALTLTPDEEYKIPITFELAEMDLGDVFKGLVFRFNSGYLNLQNSDKKLHYEIYYSDIDYGRGDVVNWSVLDDLSYDMILKLDRRAYITAEQGVYTGSLNYTMQWRNYGNDDPNPISGSIPLTLEITNPPVPMPYILSVSQGTGSGEFTEGTVVTVTADPPERGKRFLGWSLRPQTSGVDVELVSDGLTSETVSFKMPAADVYAHAHFREEKVMGYDDSYTYIKDKTYDVSKLFHFKKGTGTPSFSIVTGNDAGTGAGTLSGNQLTITKAGTIKIKAVTEDTLNEATAVLTVAKAKGTASISVANVNYGEAVTPVISCYTDAVANAVTYAKAGGGSSTSVPSEPGSYTATISYGETDLFEAVTASTTFTIGEKPAQDESNENRSEGSGDSDNPTRPDNAGNSGNSNGTGNNTRDNQSNNQANSETNNENNNNAAATDENSPLAENRVSVVDWDAVKDKLKDAISDKLSHPETEGSVIVNMNGISVVPGDVLEYIKGRDVAVVFDLGDGISWTINGMDITGDQIGDIDFGVQVGTKVIPVEVVNNVTGERYSIQISLSHNGDFGFSATLSVDMDKRNAGLFANLFYYNPNTGKLEFICADEISEDGMAELTFTHASDYTIVVDTEPMDGSLKQTETLSDDTDADDAVTGSDIKSKAVTGTIKEQTGEKDTQKTRWIILIAGVIFVLGLGGFCLIKKK